MDMKKQNIPLYSREKTNKVEDSSRYMTENKPEKQKPTEKLIMDQTNKLFFS